MEDPQEKEAQDRLRRLNMRSAAPSKASNAAASRPTLERQGSFESDTSFASSQSQPASVAGTCSIHAYLFTSVQIEGGLDSHKK